MAGKTIHDGTLSNVTAGKVNIGGTNYSVDHGRTVIDGGYHNINFINIKVGTTWTFDKNNFASGLFGPSLSLSAGQFEVPQTGYYTIELHGGGGPSSPAVYASSTISLMATAPKILYTGGSGGGSGEIWTNQYLYRGQILDIYIASESANLAVNGAESYINISGTKSYSVQGGDNALNVTSSGIVYGHGSLATNGAAGVAFDFHAVTPKGGLGNKNKPSQIYGNGADGGIDIMANSGEAGGCIITFTGV